MHHQIENIRYSQDALSLMIYEGKLIRNTQTFGKMDPFLTV